MPSVFRGSDNFDTAGGNAVKAWVNFNGTGTVAIRAAFNVSSITDNGTGNYTVNFTTAMPDANYATSVCASNPGVADGFATPASDAQTSSAIRFRCFTYNGTTVTDMPYAFCAIFR
jgi:hypothetical protein